MASARAQSTIVQATPDCTQAGRAAEQQFALPQGLLVAIGQVESGRWDARLGRVVPWPWSIDAAGEARMFDSSGAAIDATHTLQVAGARNIDVGCFQISLLHHPDAFADLQQAFDPTANARYAAQFLLALRARLGNWQDAVAAYHSVTPELGEPYQRRVFAAWHQATGDVSASLLQFPEVPGVHVWGPTPATASPRMLAEHVASPQSLPRVITPGG